MKRIACPPFDQTVCLNLGSAHSGWIEEIPPLLESLAASIGNGPSAIPQSLLAERLHGLRYIGLTDPDTMRRSKTVIVTAPETRDASSENASTAEQPKDDPLKSMINGLRDISWDPEEAGRHELRDWDELPHRDNYRSLQREHAFDPFTPPTSGTLKPADGSTCSSVRVIVDCYGLYVTSIRSWAASMKHGRVARLLKRIDSGELEDGPAVLLCPENICDIPTILAESVHPEMIRSMRLDSNPLQQFLRIVLFHEIGHHVFPIGHPATRTNDLSEALANWFAYLHTGVADRCALHLLSETQDSCYRLYQGMLPLRYPASAPLFSLVAGLSLGGGGTDATRCIERVAFDGDNRMAPTPPALASWWSWDGPFLHEFMHFGPFRALSKSGAAVAIHPAEVMAMIILRDASGSDGHRVERAFEMLRSEIGSALHPFSGLRQFVWHRRAWSQPHPAPRTFWADLP